MNTCIYESEEGDLYIGPIKPTHLSRIVSQMALASRREEHRSFRPLSVFDM